MANLCVVVVVGSIYLVFFLVVDVFVFFWPQSVGCYSDFERGPYFWRRQNWKLTFARNNLLCNTYVGYIAS